MDYKRIELKPEYQDLADEFEEMLDGRGCICHLGNPPCSICTHEGHPLNLEGTDDAWITYVVPDSLFRLEL